MSNPDEKDIVDETAADDLVMRARNTAAMIELGERFPWGTDSNLLRVLADEIERLSREIGTVPEGWHPIETGIAELADDTLVIVGCKQGFLDIWCGRYLREEKDKQDRGTYRGAPHLSWFPTHWMPRPGAPGSTAPQPPSVSSEIERLCAELNQWQRLAIQERAARKAARREALEEAAKVAETPVEDDDRINRQVRWDVATQIRSLSEDKEGG